MTTSQQPSPLGQELNGCLTAIGLELNLEHDSANWSLSNWLTWLNDNSFDIKALEEEIHSLFSETSEEELYSDIHSNLLTPAINTKATLNDLSALTAATNSEALQKIENALKQQIEAQQELTSTAGGMSGGLAWGLGGGATLLAAGAAIHKLRGGSFNGRANRPAYDYAGPRGGVFSDAEIALQGQHNNNDDDPDFNSDTGSHGHYDKDGLLDLNHDLLKDMDITKTEEEERIDRYGFRHSEEIEYDATEYHSPQDQDSNNASDANSSDNEHPRDPISTNDQDLIAEAEDQSFSSSEHALKSDLLAQSSGEISEMETSAEKALGGGIEKEVQTVETGAQDADAVVDDDLVM